MKQPVRKRKQKPFKERPLNKRKIADLDEARRHKVHHHNKLVHKAIKKAKQFEVRKVARRLKAAREGAASAKEEQVAAAEKLQHQLEAAKVLSVDAIAKEAAALFGGNESAADEGLGVLNTEQQEHETLAVVKLRILTAKCVREAIAAARSDLEQLERQLRSQQAGPSSEVLQEAGADADGVVAQHGDRGESDEGGYASQSSGAAPSPGTGTLSEEEDETEIAAKRRKLLGSSDGSEPAGEAQQRGHASKKQKPPVKKNRLGQRARRMLAGLGTGPARSRQRPTPEVTMRPSQAAGLQESKSHFLAAPKQAAKMTPINESTSAPQAGQKKEKKNIGNLHPSWVAKKAQADKASLLAKPQGNKITFDDD